jgi:3-methyladenine DNA glycosylase AlkD
VEPAPPSPDWDAGTVIAWLKARESPENKAGMTRFGVNTERTFGVPLAEIRPLSRKIRRNQERALALWETGWRDARLIAAFTAEPKRMTPAIARRWAADFDSWDVVDGVSDIFVDMPEWRELIDEFAADEREFVRRTAFAMTAWAAVHRKDEPDATFLGLLPLIEKHATDPRNFVRKAVNWALRQIGKRSPALHGPALALAEKLAASSDKTARWNGKDAVRELTTEKTIERIKAKRVAPR